jgi:hypothetical protein
MGLATGCIDEDQFECENAVGHLQKCCPGFDASSLSCSNGCDVSVAFDAEQSRCIQAMPCEAIARTGACDAARVQETVDGGIGALLCPLPGTPNRGSGVGTQPPFDAPLPCANWNECPSGEVCCTSLFGADIVNFCAAPPCASGVQPCATSRECSAGETCRPLGQSSFSGTYCRPDVDSSSEGATNEASSTRDANEASSDAAASVHADVLTDSPASDEQTVRDGSTGVDADMDATSSFEAAGFDAGGDAP